MGSISSLASAFGAWITAAIHGTGYRMELFLSAVLRSCRKVELLKRTPSTRIRFCGPTSPRMIGAPAPRFVSRA